jgi:hypothetical protein
MKVASVTNGEGVAVSYLPSDEDDLQFLAPGINDTTRHPNSDDVNVIVIIGQGLQATSSVKLEIHANYEIIPASESILAGLETEGSFYPTVPAVEIQELRQFYGDDIIRRVQAFSLGSISSNSLLKGQPITEEDKYNGDNSVDKLTQLIKNITNGKLDNTDTLIPLLSNMTTTIMSGRNDPNQKLRGTKKIKGEPINYRNDNVNANSVNAKSPWQNPALDGETRY